MSRDNLDSMRVANVGSGKLPGLDRLGVETTPLDAVAPRYLGHVSGEKRLEAWRARAARLTAALDLRRYRSPERCAGRIAAVPK